MADSLQESFIASVSHEFRTPLSSLSASLEIFSDELEHLSRNDMRELLNSIQLSVTGLQMLVDNLLDSASIEAGHFSIIKRPVKVNMILAEAIHIMQPLLDRRHQSISVLEPIKLPSLQADAHRLRQVLINLLMNASKYSPQHETIEIRIEQPPLKISVIDKGAGIPASEKAKLFEKFTRLESEEQGLGLGLSVVKAIVEGHGGQVGVESRAGGGSIFWFTIEGT